jgi:[ribosomal protein S18]-alanine N-acetyltransferase
MTGADGAEVHECTESSNTLARRDALDILPLDAEHLEDCLDLDRLCFRGLWTREQWRSELVDPHRPCLGQWQEGRLVAMACAWLILDELHITLVAVDPTRRQQGLAQGLLRALLQRSRQLGAARATLEVGSGNRAALALYRAVGFQTAGIRRGYYSNGEDALIQWLTLAALG